MPGIDAWDNFLFFGALRWVRDVHLTLQQAQAPIGADRQAYANHAGGLVPSPLAGCETETTLTAVRRQDRTLSNSIWSRDAAWATSPAAAGWLAGNAAKL